jgi:hypothetical protein
MPKRWASGDAGRDRWFEDPHTRPPERGMVERYRPVDQADDDLPAAGRPLHPGGKPDQGQHSLQLIQAGIAVHSGVHR